MYSRFLRSLKFLTLRWILRKKFLVASSILFDLKFKAAVSDMHGRRLYKRGLHDEALTRVLIEHLEFRPGDVALDIGANIGWYSLVLDRISPPHVDIFSFEPDPFNFDLLCENVRLNHASKVMPINLGVADVEKSQPLYRYKRSNLGRHSLIPRLESDTVRIRTTTVDGFWEDTGLGDRVPRFIKLDVEGYEYFALLGATRVLSRCTNLLMEYSPQYLRHAGIEPHRVLNLLVDSELTPWLAARVSGNQEVYPADLELIAACDTQWNILWIRDHAGSSANCNS